MPIIGDDIKSQVGATITHRVLTSLFRERGVHLDKTMQLNVGGNSDFLNMLERERLESKKISKTNAVTSMLDYDLGAGNVHVGPSDYVPWLTDRKWAYIRMEGTVVRRRAAQPRAEARGLGLAELGRHRHRRRPAREARAEQRRRRLARRAELVPDEVAAEADPGRRRARADREVHRAATAAARPRGAHYGSELSQVTCRGLVAGLGREADLDRAPLLPVRREPRIVARLEHDGAVMARVRAPDDDVAGEHRPPVDVLHRLQQRPRPAASVVAARRSGPARRRGSNRAWRSRSSRS